MSKIKRAIRNQYGRIGAGETGVGCCASDRDLRDTASSAPCGCQTSATVGYSDEELSSLPPGADLGLGCGNPQAIAALKLGETVLDLGSGGGIDCFLAARQVGEAGRAIGVDMTAEMIDRARQAARNTGVQNVEFRLGEIEHLPVADTTIDVILSNCVINLSADKAVVFREAIRVLKPGGRLAISDIVATAPLPAEIRENVELHVGCLAGAATIDELATTLADVGFTQIRIEPNEASREGIAQYVPGSGFENYVVSATIEAVRP